MKPGWDAGDITDRLLCIMAHIRRVRDSDVRFRQATQNLTDREKEHLRELVSLIEASPYKSAVASPSKPASSCGDGQ
eukprot:10676146-Alexandrium_andersonii.AAC.1